MLSLPPTEPNIHAIKDGKRDQVNIGGKGTHEMEAQFIIATIPTLFQLIILLFFALYLGK